MKITLVDFNDWQGLYVDGKLQDQDHEISQEVFLAILKRAGWEIEQREPQEIDGAWMDDFSTAPKKLTDIPFIKK